MGQRKDESAPLTADWLAALSERARAEGAIARADRLLLLAWQAFDGQEITPDMLACIDGGESLFQARAEPVGASAQPAVR